ncbi:MauE/DoxX family redox-associated membrane protein [Nonomuraea zeae]|uniref:MauE/DoxX family redox-associated membrane protein n=1 Tax=Nonomuraea zeae TaxID=1642303 RepID=UPI0014794EEC|nr:MauE/DoxX family redox-associated membrane protein [Nonomuraea zeae]
MPYLETGLRCLIGLVFVVSAAGKLIRRASLREFVASVAAMRLLRPGHVPGAAAVVVAGEVAVCVLMALPGPMPQAGFALAGALLVAFSVAILMAVRRQVTAACRCFGTSTVPLGRRHIARNACLAVASGLGCVAVASPEAATDVNALILAAFAGVVAGTLVVFLDELSELFGPGRFPQTRHPG